MPTIRALLLTAVAALVLAACGPSEPQAAITGVVLRGPMCPVESASSPCPDQPVAGATVTASVGGDPVASDRTDGAGRFELPVDGGRSYRVSVGVQSPATAGPERVAVAPGENAQVTLHVDTGIR